MIIGLLMENGEISAAEIDRFAAKQKIGERTVRKAKAELREADALGSRKVGQQWFHFLVTKEEPPPPPEKVETPPDNSAGMERPMMIMGAMGFHLVGSEPIETIPEPPEQLPEPQTALLTDGSQ